MADIPAHIQEREERFLSSWMRRDADDIRRLLSRDCVLIFGTNPVEVLDRPSFAEALVNDFRCLGFRMGPGAVRRYGKLAWFSGTAELELKLGVHDWQGRFLLTGLWRKHTFGGWKLIERSLAQTAENERLAGGIQRLQMWN